MVGWKVFHLASGPEFPDQQNLGARGIQRKKLSVICKGIPRWWRGVASLDEWVCPPEPSLAGGEGDCGVEQVLVDAILSNVSHHAQAPLLPPWQVSLLQDQMVSLQPYSQYPWLFFWTLWCKFTKQNWRWLKNSGKSWARFQRKWSETQLQIYVRDIKPAKHLLAATLSHFSRNSKNSFYRAFTC